MMSRRFKNKTVYWSLKEIDNLKNSYSNKEKSELLTLFPNRSWDAIKLKANSLNLFRKEFQNTKLRKSKAEKLLGKSFQSLYWIGFILADGSFSNNQKRLQVALSVRDGDHLLKLAQFLEAENNYHIRDYYCDFSCQNEKIFPQLCKAYDIKERKTYNPPAIETYKLSNDEFFSLIIGFIDGDGSITKLTNRNYYNLKIKNHSSWLSFLVFVENKIYEIFPYSKNSKQLAKIDKKGYAYLNISNFQLIKDIRFKAINFNLPILERKWNF